MRNLLRWGLRRRRWSFPAHSRHLDCPSALLNLSALHLPPLRPQWPMSVNSQRSHSSFHRPLRCHHQVGLPRSLGYLRRHLLWLPRRLRLYLSILCRRICLQRAWGRLRIVAFNSCLRCFVVNLKSLGNRLSLQERFRTVGAAYPRTRRQPHKPCVILIIMNRAIKEVYLQGSALS